MDLQLQEPLLEHQNAELTQEWLSDLFDSDNLTNRVLSEDRNYNYS